MARRTRQDTAGTAPAVPEPNGARQAPESTAAAASAGRGKTAAGARGRTGRQGPGQATPAGAGVGQTGPSFAAVEEQLRQVSQELAEARRLLGAVPGEVGEFREQLRQVGRHVPEAGEHLREVERRSGAVRQQLEEVKRECRDAQEQLAAVRRDTGETEIRLAAVRREFEDAEGRLREIRQEVQRVREQARQATAPEGRNRLGVTVDPGIVVAEVSPATPAARAGLARGDVIEAVNGTPVFDAVRLRDLVHEAPAGEEIALRVLRGGAAEEIKARLDPVAADAPRPAKEHNRLGVTVDPGVIVAEVVPDTPAARAALIRGDVIAAVNGVPVLDGAALRELIHHAAAGAEVTLRVSRGGEVREVKARLDEAGSAAP